MTTKFLADLGIDANDDFYNTDAAVDLIESETAAGRISIDFIDRSNPPPGSGATTFFSARAMKGNFY